MRFTLPYTMPLKAYKHYLGQEPNWTSGISKVTFYRTYSRLKDDGTKEHFWEVIKRCTEGCVSLLLRHFDYEKKELARVIDSIFKYKRGSPTETIDSFAQNLYEMMFEMKFLPPGRGLWTMGTQYSFEVSSIALNNCAMVSTENLMPNKLDGLTPFGFLMDVSMLGAGCGFDTKGVGTITINKPKDDQEISYQITDDREGWVQSLELLLKSYFYPNQPTQRFDYSKIRGKGEKIRGFGGVASGPDPLKELHERCRGFLNREVGKPISSRTIVDIMNSIGACVVAGNVRRSSLIAMGNPYDQTFVNLKNYQLKENDYRKSIGAYSNNSVDLSNVAKADAPALIDSLIDRTVTNGEPGYIFMDRCREYGRVFSSEVDKFMADYKAVGTNPCGEMTLHDRELCNLVEIFPIKFVDFEDLEEWEQVCKFAYIYAKSVTLAKSHNPAVEDIIQKNRRLGLSISGIAQIYSINKKVLPKIFHSSYKSILALDKKFSNLLGIPESIKLTTVKPSGTVSLIAGVTAGVHYPMGKFYLKRMRIASNSPLLKWAQHSGFKTEPAIVFKLNEATGEYEAENSTDTHIIEFPVKFFDDIKSRDRVTVEEQFDIIKMMQTYWSDNQVSATVTFHHHEVDSIKKIMLEATINPTYPLKSVSFLQNFSMDFPQMPESILSEEEYEDLMSEILDIPITDYLNEEAVGEQGCSNDTCTL